MRAGASFREISPAPGVQLAGYPHVARIATGIHDPLLASALFLSNGSSAVLICALDLLMLNPPTARQIRRRVAKSLDIPESCVLISCTHTHSGPVTLNYLPWRNDPAMPPPDPSYLQWVEDQIIEAAREAKNRAEPARLKWTSADGRGVGGNRHSPDGPVDPEAGVLTVRAADKVLAVVIIYGMHPTVLHEDSTLISSDFPHYARQHVQQAFGTDTVVLYHTAPCGNLSPRYFVKEHTFTEAERLGRMLGERIITAIEMDNTASNENTEPMFSGAIQSVRLPRRNWPILSEANVKLAAYQAEYAKLKAARADPRLIRTAEVAVFGAESLCTLVRARIDGTIDHVLDLYEPFEVQVLRIGKACVVGFPGEIFVEYSLQLKQRSRRKVFAVAYANGELQGYIVTPESAAAGGYEAASRMFEPQAANILIDSALALIDRIWP